jgi:uncharacterized phage protein (TIGR01671 family)
MRPIKFRAWNGKRMSKPFELKDAIVAVYTVGHGYRTIPFEDEIFMQFTGLLDKNGKEIYEGDVVIWGHAGGDWFLEKPIRRAIVKFDPDICFDSQVGRFEFGNFAYRNDTQKCMEVIGNIWENPELLEAKP